MTILGGVKKGCVWVIGDPQNLQFPFLFLVFCFIGGMSMSISALHGMNSIFCVPLL